MGDDTRRVWLIDDERRLVEVLAELFRAEGWEARAFGDARLALAECTRDEPPPVIVTDYDMPYLDGGRFVAELRALLGESAPPVVCITGYPGKIETDEEAAFARILVKPFRFGELFKVVEDVRIAGFRGRESSARLKLTPAGGIERAKKQETG